MPSPQTDTALIVLQSCETTSRLELSLDRPGYLLARLHGAGFSAERIVYLPGDDALRLLAFFEQAAAGATPACWGSVEFELEVEVEAQHADALSLKVVLAQATDVNDTWALEAYLSLEHGPLQALLPALRRLFGQVRG
jgi:hypothetical protein